MTTIESVPFAAGADKVFADFSGLAGQISKGDVVGAVDGKLERIFPIKNAFGEVARISSDAQTILKTQASAPKVALEGILPDGTQIRKVTTSYSSPPSILDAGSDIFAYRDGKVVGHITSADVNAVSFIGCLACHPTKNRVYILRGTTDTVNGWARSSFQVIALDSDLNILSISSVINQPAAECLPSNYTHWHAWCTADDYLCVPLINNSDQHCMIIYHIPTQTLKRAGDALVPGSYNTQASALSCETMSFIFLNAEKTRFAYFFRVYSYSSTYYEYIHIIEPSATEPILTPEPVSCVLSSPITSDFFLYCDRAVSTRESRLVKIFQAAADPTKIAWAYSTNATFGTQVLDISDPANVTTVGSNSAISVNTSNGGMFFQIGDFLVVFGMYSSTLRCSVQDLATGLTVYSSSDLATNMPTVYFKDAFCDSDRCKIYVPFWTSANMDNSDMNSSMLVFTVTPKGSVSVKMIDFPGNDIGPIRETINTGRYILILQGGYSTSSVKVDLVYHLFDKESEAWHTETTDETLLVTFSAGYQAMEQPVWPWSPAISLLSGEILSVMGSRISCTNNQYELESLWAKFDIATLVGVAASDSDGDTVRIQLSGYVGLHPDYQGIFKQVDHTTLGGNSVQVMGSVAALKGAI